MADISDVSLQASALAFTIYALAKHPEKTEKLIQVRSPYPAQARYCMYLQIWKQVYAPMHWPRVVPPFGGG